MSRACVNCFTDVADDATSCPECDSKSFFFNSQPVSSNASANQAASASPVEQRPDGSGAQTVGILAGLLGVALILWAMFMSSTEYNWGGDIDPGKIALKATLSLIGGGLLQVGLIVWLAGYIVRALSFLPGKTQK